MLGISLGVVMEKYYKFNGRDVTVPVPMGSHLPFVVFVWKFIAARTLFTARGDRPPSALPSSVGLRICRLVGASSATSTVSRKEYPASRR